MVVDIYDGKYAVPGKCGSRYWAKTELIRQWSVPTIYRVDFRDIYKKTYYIDWIVVRPPMEQLRSALQTEVMECFDDADKMGVILEKFLDTDGGGTHFHPQFCQKIYEMWFRDGYRLRILPLSELSDFLFDMGFEIPYDMSEYDFHNDLNYKSKDETWDRCVELYPDMMGSLIEHCKNDTVYYDALINKKKGLLRMI